MVRTPSCDKNGLKKGTWTPEEDKKLVDLAATYGCSNWRQLPKHAGLSRCGKSCRLRWINYLRPNVKRGNFSQEEDKLILELHESLGNRWSAIATHLPRRTDNEIKNHWHSSLKNRRANWLHNVFHVSNLRKCLANEAAKVSYQDIKVDDKMTYEEEPEVILDRRIKQLRNKEVPLVLVQWRYHKGPKATWELEEDMRKKYPQLFY